MDGGDLALWKTLCNHMPHATKEPLFGSSIFILTGFTAWRASSEQSFMLLLSLPKPEEVGSGASIPMSYLFKVSAS